ncbi:uncharacterized protein LOC135811384 isoform X2 [Sycon ciliatum]|uniref:uncharacterized protein LOC135811384 isoform X2 n=1 Tax=Sycon ciliatum TaxID=27933 RepID=UPI0031F6090E
MLARTSRRVPWNLSGTRRGDVFSQSTGAIACSHGLFPGAGQLHRSSLASYSLHAKVSRASVSVTGSLKNAALRATRTPAALVCVQSARLPMTFRTLCSSLLHVPLSLIPISPAVAEVRAILSQDPLPEHDGLLRMVTGLETTAQRLAAILAVQQNHSMGDVQRTEIMDSALWCCVMDGDGDFEWHFASMLVRTARLLPHISRLSSLVPFVALCVRNLHDESPVEDLTTVLRLLSSCKSSSLSLALELSKKRALLLQLIPKLMIIDCLILIKHYPGPRDMLLLKKCHVFAGDVLLPPADGVFQASFMDANPEIRAACLDRMSFWLSRANALPDGDVIRFAGRIVMCRSRHEQFVKEVLRLGSDGFYTGLRISLVQLMYMANMCATYSIEAPSVVSAVGRPEFTLPPGEGLDTAILLNWSLMVLNDTPPASCLMVLLNRLEHQCQKSGMRSIHTPHWLKLYQLLPVMERHFDANAESIAQDKRVFWKGFCDWICQHLVLLHSRALAGMFMDDRLLETGFVPPSTTPFLAGCHPVSFCLAVTARGKWHSIPFAETNRNLESLSMCPLHTPDTTDSDGVAQHTRKTLHHAVCSGIEADYDVRFRVRNVVAMLVVDERNIGDNGDLFGPASVQKARLESSGFVVTAVRQDYLESHFQRNQTGNCPEHGAVTNLHPCYSALAISTSEQLYHSTEAPKVPLLLVVNNQDNLASLDRTGLGGLVAAEADQVLFPPPLPQVLLDIDDVTEPGRQLCSCKAVFYLGGPWCKDISHHHGRGQGHVITDVR